MPIFIEQVQDTKMVLSSQLVQTQAARLVLCTSPVRFSCVSLQNGGWAAESLRCLYLVPGATFTGSCLGTDIRAWRTSAGAFLRAGPRQRVRAAALRVCLRAALAVPATSRRYLSDTALALLRARRVRDRGLEQRARLRFRAPCGCHGDTDPARPP